MANQQYRTSHICYDDTAPGRSGGFVKYHDIKATEGFIRHFSNMLYLEFVAKNSLATLFERQQANKEILICQRKLDYHRRHPNFEMSRAEQAILDLRKQWQSGKT